MSQSTAVRLIVFKMINFLAADADQGGFAAEGLNKVEGNDSGYSHFILQMYGDGREAVLLLDYDR